MEVFVKRIGNHVLSLPQYGSAEAAGFDLVSASPDKLMIQPGRSLKVPCGFAYQIPVGYYGAVLGRSGLALKGVLCHVGTVDSDYRGEVAAILTNNASEAFTICPGDRIAQMVLVKFEQAQLVEREELQLTARGTGGFGSTGVVSMQKGVLGHE